MTNWSSNSYRIEGKQEDLQQIYDLFVKFDKGRRKPFDEQTSKDWEGNIVWALGGETKDYYLRGFIQTCEISEGLLCIEAEEAWGATGFRHFLEKHYQDMSVYFCVEEEGEEIYATNDINGKYFKFRYMVNSCIDGVDEWEYFNTSEEALQYIANRLEIDSLTISQLETWQENHVNEDDYICFNEYKIVA